MARLELGRSSAARKSEACADGGAIDRRALSGMGTVWVPDAGGTIKPAVGDGYWSYIPPPAPGRHVLKFRSANVNNFTLDVTYNLTVA